MSAPSKFLLLAEARGLIEGGAGLLSAHFLKSIVPPGDAQPVLVLPGLGLSDTATKPLRTFLQKMGYVTYGWNLGINKGVKSKNALGEMITLVKSLYATHNRKISIVGHDMGGILAREVAKMIPDMVRQVIAVGSPFNGRVEDTHAGIAHMILNHRKITQYDIEFSHHLGALKVPFTSIFSKMDGVIAWQSAIEDNLHQAENIEILGSSHSAMMTNPQGLYLIAHRLAEPESAWKAFVMNEKNKVFFKN